MLVDGIGRDTEYFSDFYPACKIAERDTVYHFKHGSRKGNRSSAVFPERMVGKDKKMKKMSEQAYAAYVKEKTPVHNVYANMGKAFVTGGTICLIGQVILNYCKSTGMKEEIAGSWTSLVLVLISVLLTGVNIYPGIAKWGGAGALVPITGFANSVAAPAIEYKKEGQVFGIGCKIFTIAGPVILYGILTSWVLGLIYYFLMKAGIVL